MDCFTDIFGSILNFIMIHVDVFNQYYIYQWPNKMHLNIVSFIFYKQYNLVLLKSEL